MNTPQKRYKMLTPKQTRIFEAFLRKPYKEFTYREIKEYSKEKSNSLVQKAIVKFCADELVKKKKVGNIILYELNFDNTNVFSYFDLLINEKLPKAVKRCIKNLKEEIKEIDFISIILFGSYAEGKQTGKSDLDVAVFVKSQGDKKNCKLGLKSAELKCPLPLDAHVFTKDEMLQMLRDRHENLGKQITRKHLAIFNPVIFYSIVQEGIDHGFRIVY